MLKNRYQIRCLGLVAMFLACLNMAKADQAGGGSCDSRLSLCSPKAVRAAFEATGDVTQQTGNFPIPALVSENVYIRAMKLDKKIFPQGNDPEFVKSLGLIRTGVGQWFAFVGGHDLVEKVLVAGRRNATQVYRDVGYGAKYTCGDSDYYWLVVFQDTSRNVIKDGIYKNLNYWLRHVYGKRAPSIPDNVLNTLMTKRFTEVTGCPVKPDTGAFDGNVETCIEIDFKNAAKNDFSNTTCAGDPKALRYSSAAGCPSDTAFLDYGNNINAQQLRAYLYKVAGFNEFNTGYGYTANAYNDPLSHEYWTDNTLVKDLPRVELMQVECTGPGNSSAPVEDSNMVGDSPYVTVYE
jgi:hypothetical protein